MAVVELNQHWICCQIGAREHYAVPRALHRSEMLARVITDSWRSPFASRCHPDLPDTSVAAFNASLMGFELGARIRRLRGWDRVVARNQWFQRKVVSALSGYQPSTLNSEPTLFAYSYAALDIFRFAKERGWKTVLGQIDPGPVEEEIVRAEHEAHPEFKADWEPAPPEYWQNWREECDLADHIMVNSEWSRACLVKEGVNGSKLSVIPLAYESPITSLPITRAYPVRFTRERPLRVLFLGQINLRKGVARLLEAAAALGNEPIEFWMVGPDQCQPPNHLGNLPNVRWFGRTARDEAQKYYREADVFILPTLSDGFALTQLEAQAHGLPIIASRSCGEVVTHGVNGLLLAEPTPDAIIEALRSCLANPDRLDAFSAASRVEDRFSIAALSANLLSLSNV